MTKDDTSNKPDLMSDKDIPERQMEHLQKSLSDIDALESDKKKQQL
jgi:hypothetical protein